jgi:hypothetical protein
MEIKQQTSRVLIWQIVKLTYHSQHPALLDKLYPPPYPYDKAIDAITLPADIEVQICKKQYGKIEL